MMPRLEAQRELASIQAMGAAFGGMRASDRQRYMARLQRQSSGQLRAAPATPGALAAMGVSVVVVPAEVAA